MIVRKNRPSTDLIFSSRTVKIREMDKNGCFQGHSMFSHGRGILN
jgi:hypothetical protein